MKYFFFGPGRSTTIKLHWRRTLLLFVLYSAMQSAIAQDSLPVAKQKDTLPQPPRRQTPLTQKDFTLLKEYPVLWQQTAAEYRALCYQAFNIALLRINEIPKKQFKKQKLAIITDLDETILDNSYSEAQLIKEGKSYSMKSWKEWVNKSAATGVPGAVEFLQAASKKGISIFYVSNRDQLDVKSTLINLQKLELPNADTAHMLFLVDSSSKESRRQLLTAQYNVVMLLGDNLNDFMNVFESKNIAGRFAETDKQKDEWGKKFIVLPNATYGEWESALTNYLKGLKPEQKEAMRRALLKGFN